MHLTLNAEYDRVPLGSDHPRAVAPRRRRRLPPHDRPTCGTTPTSTRCDASCGPRSSGRSCGASTSATSTATWARSSSSPSSSTSTSTSPSSSACRLRLSGASTETDHRLPVPPPRCRGGRALPRPLRARPRRRVPPGDRAGRRRPATWRHRGLRPSRRRLTGAASARARLVVRVDDHELVTNDRSLRAMLDRLGVHLVGYREIRELQRA